MKMLSERDGIEYFNHIEVPELDPFDTRYYKKVSLKLGKHDTSNEFAVIGPVAAVYLRKISTVVINNQRHAICRVIDKIPIH
jgi:hypothetical protein